MRVRSFGFCILVLLVLSLATGCPPREEAKGLLRAKHEMEARMKRFVLPNGLVLLTFEDREVPFAVLSSWIRVGSAYEHRGQTGLAHLFEHLMFKGTKTVSADDFFKQLESKGAEVNAQTQEDLTTYYEVMAPELMEKAIALEADRLRHLVLDKRTLDREREVVKEERHLRVESRFGSQQYEALRELMFGEHPYGWPTIGYFQDLESLEPADLQSFYDTYYQPDQVVLVAAGHIEPEKVRQWVEKSYGSYAKPSPSVVAKRAHPEKEPLPELNGQRRKVLQRPVQYETVLLGYRLPPMSHEDLPALTALSWILFSLNTSQIHKALVEDKRLALSVQGDVEMGALASHLVIAAQAAEDVEAESLLEQFDGQLAEEKARGIHPDQLNRIRRQLEFKVLQDTRSVVNLASWISFGEVYFHDCMRLTRYMEQLQSLSVADVVRVFRTYLLPEKRAVVLMKKGGGQS